MFYMRYNTYLLSSFFCLMLLQGCDIAEVDRPGNDELIGAQDRQAQSSIDVPDTSSQDSISGTGKGLIVGGVAANFADFPFLVSIEKNGVHDCAGTLIRKNWVLTAAHCVDDEDSLKVRVPRDGGDDDGMLSRVPVNSILLDIENIYMHDNDMSESLENDIALLYLGDSVDLSRRVLPMYEQDSAPEGEKKNYNNIINISEEFLVFGPERQEASATVSAAFTETTRDRRSVWLPFSATRDSGNALPPSSAADESHSVFLPFSATHDDPTGHQQCRADAIGISQQNTSIADADWVYTEDDQPPKTYRRRRATAVGWGIRVIHRVR